MSSSLSFSWTARYLPSHCRGGVPSWHSCSFYCSQNYSASVLISQHSLMLWHLELCIGNCGPPSLLSEGCHGRLSPRGPQPPPAAVIAAMGALASGVSLLSAFFFFFLPLL
jgi:hypothetical protein